MQTRRLSLSSLPLPSSPPPFALQHLGNAYPPSEADDPVSPTWTAPSPARTLGHSSPELPPLPSLSSRVTNPRTPSTAARNERTDTSYYTASWGSPYRNPPPAFHQPRHLSANLGSDDFDEDSSTLHFGLGHLLPSRLEIQDESPNRFNLEHLIPRLEQSPSPNQFTLEHLIRSRLPDLETPTKQPGTTPRASAPHPTSEEWVRQFLQERWNPEVDDWKSDDSGTEASDQGEGLPIQPPPKRGHKTGNANKTLNQQDFWRHFSKDQKKVLGRMMSSKYADPDVLSHTTQASNNGQSLQKVNNAGVGAVKPSLEHPSRPPLVAASQSHLTPPESAPATAPRIRKKVLVKGKGCIISIPPDIPRGKPGYPPKPMSAEAVDAKLQYLQRQGYDVRGFSTGHLEPHNRAIWPAEADVRAERADIGSRFQVRVAKESQWKDYQNSLLEAKLAALGVSMGGEEDIPLPMSRQTSSQQHPGTVFSPPLPTSSAGSLRITRQGSIVSGNFPLGPSPGHMSRQSMASPAAFGPTSGHMSRQSIASPAAFANQRPSMHMHRHSTFGSPANFAQHAISPSGTWSPGGYFTSQDGRSGSPGLPLNRPDLSGLISPHSPFGARSNQQFPITPAQKDDFLLQMQMQQQQLQTQMLQQQQQQLQTQMLQQQQQQQQQLLGMRPSSTLAEVPEDDDEEEEEEEEEESPVMKHSSQPPPEIAVPTPRGHRHNISENLEREAASEEYHLEDAIDKQFAEGGDFSTEPEVTEHFETGNAVAEPNWEESGTVLHQPQPHSRAHSLAKSQPPMSFAFPSVQDDGADLDDALTNLSENTNPSLEDGEVRNIVLSSAQHSKAPSQFSNSWNENKFAFSKPASAVHSKHTSRSSISKLNVEAKEFKFNPTASFNPDSFSAGFNFAPPTQPPSDASTFRGKKPSIGGTTNFNVVVPTFKPEAPVFKPHVPIFKPTAETPIFEPAAKPVGPKQNDTPFPSSGFHFSSPPSLKPDAPVFNPKVSPFMPINNGPAPTTFSSKIFGHVNISAGDIVKPASRSKAVPIVRPELATQEIPGEDEEREDESGRPMQADGREKRARRGRTDGDDIPKFALQPILASQPLAEAREFYSIGQDPILEHHANAEDKEIFLPNRKRAETESSNPDMPSEQNDVSASERSNPGAHSVDFSLDAAADDHTPDASDVATPTIEHPTPTSPTTTATTTIAAIKHGHKSTLSANAKSFEFRPQISGAGYDFGLQVTKPSQVQDPEKAHHSPPSLASRSPATTFRPSDDGSYKTALEGGRLARYPESESVDLETLGDASFNDIDAVMKHMNEEGSDFGIERGEHSWEQSSPQRTPHSFVRKDLQPNLKLRSDAPSPSPRRVYAPRNAQDSATSNQDPFDDERAVLTYDSPVHRLNNADEVPMSDWDEGLLTEGEDKIQMRSRFFDKHVDDLMGRHFQDRLSPLEQNLRGIQDILATMSQRPMRGRHSMSTNDRLDSDADDEDDDIGVDSHNRNRSPRKERRLEKIRSIVRDTLEVHQSQIRTVPVPALEPVVSEKIREIITDVLVTHQPPAAPVEFVSADQIRTIFAESFKSHVSLHAEAAQATDIRTIVMDAITTHAPQPAPKLDLEQILPNLKAVFAEALTSHQWTVQILQAIEPLQPDVIRSIVVEALAAQKAVSVEALNDPTESSVKLSEIYQLIGSLENSITQNTDNQLKASDVREFIGDAFKHQSMELASRKESQAMQEKDARITELEAKLKEATIRSDADTKARATMEAREMDTARLLKVTEEELVLLQQAAKEDDDRMRALTEERDALRHGLDEVYSSGSDIRDRLSSQIAEIDDLKVENIALKSSEEDLKQKLNSVVAENEALSITLEEHRQSAQKWRDDNQVAHEESERLRQALDQARYQADEATRVRETMRAKIEKLQQDMVIASQQVALERAQSQKNEEATLTKYEILSARIEAEGRTRERLEQELERLETQEREGMKLRIHLEQTQKHNARLEETIDQLRKESLEHQKNAERYERDMREARDAAHVEIRRTRVLMDADIDAANNQVNIVRHELESEIARVRAELDQVRLDADTSKERHELDLEAASDMKIQAVHEAQESKRHSLQEQQRVFERQLEHLKQDHARAFEFAREDRERAEAFHMDKLALADSKLDHFKDKIALLQEKLHVAKEAANAAAAAASKSPVPNSTSAPSGSEKISPQALRESIVVLQEQLQAREGHIESLERQLEDFDTEAPTKLKERDTEINWLRELLGVRIDDLNDLIKSLAQPTFDRELVRDAAIRIRTNLQMEQSEKERLISGNQQSFPTLSTLSNFASPKAVQLAAAFGNWRKGRGEATSTITGTSAGSTPRNQTPSRRAPHSGNSFLSGLMTPPTSNMRRTPDLQSASKRPQNLRSNSSSSLASTDAGFPSLSKTTQSIAPKTPPLMRKASYDRDADAEPFNESGFYDDESTVDGETTPLPLHFGRELER